MAQLQDGDLSAYAVGLIVFLVPGALMLLVLLPAWFWTRKPQPGRTRTGLAWWALFALSALVALAGVLCSVMTAVSLRSAVQTTVVADATALVYDLQGKVSVLAASVHTLQLDPLLEPTEDLPADSTNTLVQELRALASDIRAQVAEVPAATTLALGDLSRVRFTLEARQADADEVRSLGTNSAYALGSFLLAAFLAAGVASVWSKPSGVFPAAVVLGLVVFVAFPAATVMDDTCAYYGDIRSRAADESALALACVNQESLVTLPLLDFAFPLTTQVNTSTPLGAQVQGALDGLFGARDLLQGATERARALQAEATCGPVAVELIRARDTLCRVPGYTRGACLAALAWLAFALAGLFCWTSTGFLAVVQTN